MWIHDTKTTCRTKELKGRGVWVRANQRRHAGDEDGASIGDRHAEQSVRSHRTRCRSGPVVAHTGTWLFEHQAGGSRGVAAYPLCIDPFTAQALENSFAGGIR